MDYLLIKKSELEKPKRSYERRNDYEIGYSNALAKIESLCTPLPLDAESAAKEYAEREFPMNVLAGPVEQEKDRIVRKSCEKFFLAGYATAKSKWIPVSEQLPELDKQVLLFDDWKTSDGESRKDICVGHLSEYTTIRTSTGVTHSCEWRGTEYAFNITHWQPLPEKP